MFHVGQLVVCVDDRRGIYTVPGRRYYHDSILPRKGVVYTVRAVGLGVADDTPCLWVEEIVRPRRTLGREDGFAAARFRPLKDSALDVFTALLEPAPKQTEPA